MAVLPGHCTGEVVRHRLLPPHFPYCRCTEATLGHVRCNVHLGCDIHLRGCIPVPTHRSLLEALGWDASGLLCGCECCGLGQRCDEHCPRSIASGGAALAAAHSAAPSEEKDWGRPDVLRWDLMSRPCSLGRLVADTIAQRHGRECPSASIPRHLCEDLEHDVGLLSRLSLVHHRGHGGLDVRLFPGCAAAPGQGVPPPGRVRPNQDERPVRASKARKHIKSCALEPAWDTDNHNRRPRGTPPRREREWNHGRKNVPCSFQQD